MLTWLPLSLLIGLDIWAIPQIVTLRDGSITDGIAGAYIGLGLLILQAPLCYLGWTSAGRANRHTLAGFYKAHIAMTILVAIWSNLDPH